MFYTPCYVPYSSINLNVPKGYSLECARTAELEESEIIEGYSVHKHFRSKLYTDANGWTSPTSVSKLDADRALNALFKTDPYKAYTSPNRFALAKVKASVKTVQEDLEKMGEEPTYLSWNVDSRISRGIGTRTSTGKRFDVSWPWVFYDWKSWFLGSGLCKISLLFLREILCEEGSRNRRTALFQFYKHESISCRNPRNTAQIDRMEVVSRLNPAWQKQSPAGQM